MTRVTADDINDAATAHDFALVADPLHTGSNLHSSTSLVSFNHIWRNV